MAVMGLGTYVFRASMILVGARAVAGTGLDRTIALIGPAVVGAIVTGSLFVGPSGGRTWPPASALVALAAAFVAVRRTGNIAAALVVGLPLAWLTTSIGL
jgi:branched-subunit amino acid transport protein